MSANDVDEGGGGGGGGEGDAEMKPLAATSNDTAAVDNDKSKSESVDADEGAVAVAAAAPALPPPSSNAAAAATSGDDNNGGHHRHHHQHHIHMPKVTINKLKAKKVAKTTSYWIWLVCMIAIPSIVLIILVAATYAHADRDLAAEERAPECALRFGWTPQMPAEATLTLPSSATSDFYTLTIQNVSEPVEARVDCALAAKQTLAQVYRVPLALVPLVVVFQGILGLRLSSRYVAPFALLCTIVIGGVFFADSESYRNDSLNEMSGKVLLTLADRLLWTVFRYAGNMLSALFFLEVLKRWGIVESIRKEFADVTSDDNLLVCLVMFSFGMILATVAPGGSNYLMAAAILIRMELKPSAVSDEDAARICDEYDARHAAYCDDDECGHDTATRENKLTQDSANRVGAIALFSNALSSAFNLLGVMVVATAPLVTPLDPLRAAFGDEKSLNKHGEKEIGRLFSLQFWLLAALAPLFVQTIWSRRKWLWQKAVDKDVSWRDRSVLIVTGVTFATVQALVAAFIGPELPCLLGGGAGLLVFIVAVRGKDIVRREWPHGGRSRRYLLPFLLLVVLLLLVSAIPSVNDALTGKGDPGSSADKILSPVIAPAFSKIDFPWLAHPGIIVTLIALLTPLMVPFHEPDEELELDFPGEGAQEDVDVNRWRSAMSVIASMRSLSAPLLRTKRKRKIGLALRSFGKRYRLVLRGAAAAAWDDTKGILLSITAFATTAKLMASFGMTQAIAQAIVDALRDAPAVYAFFIPVIGALGAGLTGSTTTSNFLFAQLQCQTALDLGLVTATRNSVYEVTAAGILGATAGEIISPMNAIVITLLRGVDKKESDLIRDLLGIAGMWLVACMLLSGLFLLPTSFID